LKKVTEEEVEKVRREMQKRIEELETRAKQAEEMFIKS
jgi:hypothetical protein